MSDPNFFDQKLHFVYKISRHIYLIFIIIVNRILLIARNSVSHDRNRGMIVDETFPRTNRGETYRVIYFQQTCGVCPINKRLPSARHSPPVSNLAVARPVPPMQKRKNKGSFAAV